MATVSSFGDVLEAADQLALDDQETLIDILRRRVAERRRADRVADVIEAEREFSEGKCRPVSVDDLMAEIQS